MSKGPLRVCNDPSSPPLSRGVAAGGLGGKKQQHHHHRQHRADDSSDSDDSDEDGNERCGTIAELKARLNARPSLGQAAQPRRAPPMARASSMRHVPTLAYSGDSSSDDDGDDDDEGEAEDVDADDELAMLGSPLHIEDESSSDDDELDGHSMLSMHPHIRNAMQQHFDDADEEDEQELRQALHDDKRFVSLRDARLRHRASCAAALSAILCSTSRTSPRACQQRQQQQLRQAEQLVSYPESQIRAAATVAALTSSIAAAFPSSAAYQRPLRQSSRSSRSCRPCASACSRCARCIAARRITNRTAPTAPPPAAHEDMRRTLFFFAVANANDRRIRVPGTEHWRCSLLDALTAPVPLIYDV